VTLTLVADVSRLCMHPTATKKLNIESRALVHLHTERSRPTTPILLELQSALQSNIEASFDKFCTVCCPISFSDTWTHPRVSHYCYDVTFQVNS